VAAERRGGHGSPIPARQLVITALAQLRLANQPPITVKYLQAGCGVSYSRSWPIQIERLASTQKLSHRAYGCGSRYDRNGRFTNVATQAFRQ
jgi:hypothetical protein